MAAKQPRLGLQHVTVVPTNFRGPGPDAAAEATAEADEDEA